MEQDKQVGHFVASILIKILPLLVFLCVGLYFGIRIGEGRYEFYKPNSPYYKKAIQQASSSGFSEGWDSGYDFKQKEEYNDGWSAGYKFCLNENKSIRNNYDEGYDYFLLGTL